jgi:hypothetical protein
MLLAHRIVVTNPPPKYKLMTGNQNLDTFLKSPCLVDLSCLARESSKCFLKNGYILPMCVEMPSNK